MVQICERCGGQLEIDTLRQVATCPYCDTVFSLSEKVEKSRQQWEEWVQGDDCRRSLQEAWQENAQKHQKLQRKTDRLLEKLELPLRWVCIGAIFFFAAMASAWLKMGIQMIGDDPSLTVSLWLGWVFCLFLLMIPLVVLRLLWRWKDRYRESLQAKAAADFYQRELQLWHTVHSLENYQKGTVEEEPYRRGAQTRRAAFEQQTRNQGKRWQRYISMGLPLLLGLLLGLSLNLTMV